MPRPPSSGLGSALGTGTPHSSRRSVTSDYDTSSILDSASMYGGDEPSTPSPPIRSQVQQQQQQQQQREVYVGDELPPRSNSTRRKSKEPSPSTTLPIIVTTKVQNNSSPLRSSDNSRSFSVTGDDIEAAFDAINDYKASTNESSINKTKEHEMSSPDSLFGLSTIKEAIDTDEIVLGAGSSKRRNDEIDEIDFDNCFNKYKQQQEQQTQINIVEEKKTKKSAPSTPVVQQSQKNQEPKSTRHSKEQKYTAPIYNDDIYSPSTSIQTPKIDITPILTDTVPATKQKENDLDDSNDSIDEDVDELLGKLEVSIYLSLIYTHIHTHTYIHTYSLK
jgi:hypothetical protein